MLYQGLLVTCRLTRERVALKAGLGAPFVGEVLRGFRDPSPDAAKRIALALGAEDATAAKAQRLAEQVHAEKQAARKDRHTQDPLSHMAGTILRAWHALCPGVTGQDSAPVEGALARAITGYATSEGRLDIAGPLLTWPPLLAEPEVAAEFAKVPAGLGTPDPDLIGRRWRAAMTDPTHSRDFAVEAEALLERFRTAWQAGSTPAGCGAARRELTEVTALAGQLTTGPLSPALRLRLLDQTSLIATHVSGFVGRDSILRELSKVIRTRDSAYCHVLAHPGVVKTALMATLVRAGDYVYHFNVATLGVVKPEAFLGNICARLIARYRPERTLPGPEAFGHGGYLSDLLTDIAARRGAEKVVVVVDALDESDTSTLLPGTNPLFLPPELPDGVFFVVSSRPQDETRPAAEWRPAYLRASAEQVVFAIDHLGEDNMRDIRRYLELWPDRPGVARYMRGLGYDAATFTAELASQSEGNFMYLHHVLPAIDRGELADRELAALPLGLLQYYADHLRRMRDEDVRLWYEYRQPVIAAFVQAPARPLTVAEIAGLSGIGNEAIVTDTLRRWSAFVVAEHIPDDPRPAYRIYHSRFAEFLGGST